jgi:hypothetical protein
MPSFSKECFGGFVGFQGVTIEKNLFSTLQTFCAPRRPRDFAPPEGEMDFVDERTFLGCPQLLHSMNFNFRKENT